MLALAAAGERLVCDTSEDEATGSPTPQEEVVIVSDSDEDHDFNAIGDTGKHKKGAGFGFEWLDAEGRVTVEENLLGKLEEEVSTYIRAAKENKVKQQHGTKKFLCPACPSENSIAAAGFCNILKSTIQPVPCLDVTHIDVHVAVFSLLSFEKSSCDLANAREAISSAALARSNYECCCPCMTRTCFNNDTATNTWREALQSSGLQ